MALGDDLRDFLIASPQSVTDPITVGELPPSPDLVVAIRPSGGQRPALAMGPTVVQRPVTVLVVTRGVKDGYVACEVLAQQVHTILQAIGETTINATVYSLVVAVDEPAFLGTDDTERPMFAANYELTVRVA